MRRQGSTAGARTRPPSTRSYRRTAWTSALKARPPRLHRSPAIWLRAFARTTPATWEVECHDLVRPDERVAGTAARLAAHGGLAHREIPRRESLSTQGDTPVKPSNQCGPQDRRLGTKVVQFG